MSVQVQILSGALFFFKIFKIYINMAHKAKMKKKNKVVPCVDANVHAKEHIAMRNHKKEVIRKKIEQMMQERKQAMEKDKVDASSENV